MRKRLSKKRDRKVFGKTANKTKSINLSPNGMRGGVRL